MSTTRSPPSDDNPEEIDPHGIIPDSFLADWQADSIREAMRKAEAAPSTSDLTTRKRCPACGSTAWFEKGDVEMDHKRPEPNCCSDCGEHFNEPAPSKQEAMAGERVTLDAFGDQ